MKNIRLSFTLILLGLLSVTSGIINADSGEFEYAVSGSHNLKNINFKDITYTGGHLTGAMIITKSTGGAFKVGMGGTMECVVFSEKSVDNGEIVASCHINFTGADGGFNSFLKRKTGTIQSSGSGGKGTQELHGVGSMQKIKGNCEYSVQFHALKQVTSLGKCKWSN